MLYVGQRHVLTYGVEGIMQQRITTVYVNGHKVGHKIAEKVARHPVSELVLVGRKIRPKLGSNTLTGRSESGFDVLQTLTVVATAYIAGGRTASGVPAEPGVIAVDPSVIPLGTKLYIRGIGIVRAEDTGGAIQGNRIDICVSSAWAADQWGVRTIQIYKIQ
jgi:3D (Asp-Asp-Asp) domain-containing protein